MKTVKLVLLLAFVQTLSITGLSAAPADSQISAVTVYQDRAIVTRSASVQLAVGEQTVVFENLPAAMVDQSLQASGRGAAAATILDVTAKTVFSEAAPNAGVKALEDEIKGYQKQRRVLDDRSKILEEQRGFVQRMLQASTTPTGNPTTGTVGRPTLEEWQRLAAYADESLGKIAAQQQGIDGEKEELQAKQSAAERKLNELRGARGRQSKTVTVRLALASAGRLDVAIRYSVPSAGWTPSYDARLRSSDRTVELSYFGVVRNGTGEDWKDIALTLSTARPGAGGAAPELRPWITAIAVPTPISSLPMVNTVRDGLSVIPGGARGGGGGGGGNAQVFNSRAEAAAAAPPPMLESTTLAAAVDSAVTSATFRIPNTVSVAGNNVSQKVAINTTRLAATLQFQSTPKMVEAAFLSAYANNTSDYPLLAGPMNTLLDDTFVAASSLKTVMPGEKFELALGVDDGITVKRKLVNRFSEDTGLTNKSRRVTYEILITITNNKLTAERVVFKEPTPVSRDEKISVKVLNPAEKEVGTLASPKEITREEDGKLVWRITMKPGEKREFPLKLSIEYPADMQVTGVE